MPSTLCKCIQKSLFHFKSLYMAATLLLSPTLLALIDLEDKAQDFVLTTQKIEVPGYPLVFNPSIIRWQGSLLMSFRHIPDPRNSFTSHIGLIWLNEDFTPASEPQLVDTQAEDPFTTSLIPQRSEDARLVLIGERLYMVYSDNKDLRISKGGFRVYLGEVVFDGKTFALKNIECLSSFELESKERREKNWTPFDFQGEMFLAYSITPHRIFRPLLGTGSCETAALTACGIDWPFGELRGGTPALLMDGRYLSFFHSSIEMESVHSQGKNVMHYFMGAYTFNPTPPFEITAISPEPIVGKQFYHGAEYKPFWRPIRCVFPGGYIFDDKYIWVVYGRQDHELWVAKLDRQGLLQSLVPTTPLAD